MPKRTNSSKILVACAMGVFSLTSPTITLACDRSAPMHVPLEGEKEPFYESLGPMESFRIRKIAGWFESRIFRGIDGKVVGVDAPLAKADLILKSAILGQVVKVATTDDQGHFEIPDMPRGLYVLWIEQGDKPSRPEKIEGGLLIDLRIDAKDSTLSRLALSMSDCGIDIHKKNNENSSNQELELHNAQTH